jgi:hypothetical protein
MSVHSSYGGCAPGEQAVEDMGQGACHRFDGFGAAKLSAELQTFPNRQKPQDKRHRWPFSAGGSRIE